MEHKEASLTGALHSLVTGVTIWSYYHHNAFCLAQVVMLVTYISELKT